MLHSRTTLTLRDCNGFEIRMELNFFLNLNNFMRRRRARLLLRLLSRFQLIFSSLKFLINVARQTRKLRRSFFSTPEGEGRWSFSGVAFLAL